MHILITDGWKEIHCYILQVNGLIRINMKFNPFEDSIPLQKVDIEVIKLKDLCSVPSAT